ncbi:hypothetical protein GJ744_011956 [Endocarpon pusillum]|uniref:Peptidase A1 domain-containing protein n=1 Tax=Endocarpon pusillum TaxID=364733 RepID=A0A8H7APH8_9EURO|nr:hypothetical protein GJ744_011956 [Endocarpon pusillum]
MLCILPLILFRDDSQQTTYDNSGEDSPLPSPVTLPIRNITLQNVTRRAAAISIGTPPQDIGFEVAPYVNNLFVYPAGTSCHDNSAQIRCTTALMGVYDYNVSTTSQPNFLAKFAQDTVNNTGLLSGADVDLTGDILLSDLLRINKDTLLEDFPIDVNRASASRRNMLGVGASSTILGFLKESRIIRSTVWSYFDGLYGLTESENLDGHVVFGGYDAAKTSGLAFMQRKSEANQGCLTNLMISVADVLVDIDGEPLSLVGNLPGSGLQMCIDPSFKLLSLPLQLWNNFEQSVDGTEVHVHDAGIVVGAKYFAAETIRYSGNLTFRLDSGLDILIPSHQLIQPHRFINNEGALTTNASTRAVMIASLENENAKDMPLLGHPFLAAAYMMVNNEEDTFTLWQSNPTSETRLVPAEQLCSNQTAPISNSKSTSILSPGAIAGISIGSLAVAALAGVIGWYLLRRARCRAHIEQGQVSTMYTKAEMPDSPILPVMHELSDPNTRAPRPDSVHRLQAAELFGGDLPTEPGVNGRHQKRSVVGSTR